MPTYNGAALFNFPPDKYLNQSDVLTEVCAKVNC